MASLPNGNLIHRWHPFEIGSVVEGALAIHTTYSTPAWWRHLRGSAPPFEVEGRKLCLAHLVTDSSPRQYLSVLVELEPASLRPMAASLPFIFFGDIEYCLSAVYRRGEIHFFVSHWDREPFVVVTPLTWLPELVPI